jgi:hypothetical protein
MELTDEDVCLVDLVGNDDQLLFGSELQNAIDVLLAERSSSGIAGVDDGNGADICAFVASFLEGRFDAFEIRSPCLGFI